MQPKDKTWNAIRMARKRAKGGAKSGKSGHKVTKMDRASFLAIDGEGEDEGELIQVGENLDNQGPQYSYLKHKLTLMAAYDAETGQHHELVNPDRSQLGTAACLDFLLSVAAKYPKRIMVCYGASYDVNKMLTDLSYREAKAVANSTKKHGGKFKSGGYLYVLYYTQRKEFRVERYKGNYCFDLKTRKKLKPEASFTLWDVIGFFQCTFVKAMLDWLDPSDSSLALIKAMKHKRSNFRNETMADIIDYNRAELVALAEIMSRLVGALKHEDVDLTLQRWDGAGAVAAALYKKHDTKEHKRDTQNLDPDVFMAARHAYAGGHIECMQVGYEPGTVEHYDVNSAYPSIIRDLPSLASGRWVHGGLGSEPIPGFTMVRVRWFWPFEGHAFYPLFHRGEKGEITFPCSGEGWYWYPEFAVARKFNANIKAASTFQIVESWHWENASDVKPFAWVQELFNRRAALKKMGGAGKAPQIIIKLGLNSLYGKMCQQVGYEHDKNGVLKTPPFFQLEWAGFVTASTRALLMDAALQNPKEIIAVATDGIYSRTKLDLPVGPLLGQWDYNQHAGMCSIMAGFYAYANEAGTWTAYTRGLEKKDADQTANAAQIEDYRNHWRQGAKALFTKQSPLIGLKRATIADKPGLFWDMRGCFVTSNRVMNLTGFSSKRTAYDDNASPHLRMVPTYPRPHTEADITEGRRNFHKMSKPHDLKWKLRLGPDDMAEMENWQWEANEEFAE